MLRLLSLLKLLQFLVVIIRGWSFIWKLLLAYIYIGYRLIVKFGRVQQKDNFRIMKGIVFFFLERKIN